MLHEAVSGTKQVCLMQLVAHVHNINPQPHYTILNGLLFFLFCLHLYWYASFLRICSVVCLSATHSMLYVWHGIP